MNWKVHCSNPDSNVALERFLQMLNKLLDKNFPYIMLKSRSSLTSKPGISTEITNSIKNKIYNKFCKGKTTQQR